jgi:hypothetical protein
MFNSISKKILFAFGIIIILVMASFAFTLIKITKKDLILELEKNLKTETNSYYRTVQLYNDTLEENAVTLLTIFKKSFRNIQTRNNDDTTKIDGIITKNIYNGFARLNSDFHPVDLFTEQTGAVASVYVKDNDEYINVTSSLIKKDGKRNLLEKITSQDSKKFAALEKRENYVSLESIDGESYISAYTPIIENDKIIGALFIGYKFTNGLKSIKKKLKEVVIGKTGSIFVINSKGILEVDKKLEGKNILNIKDSDGDSFIKNILKEKKWSYPI